MIVNSFSSFPYAEGMSPLTPNASLQSVSSAYGLNNQKLAKVPSQYEEIPSPSTDYTDMPETQFCEPNEFGIQIKTEGFTSDFVSAFSYSAKFISEISSFEPLVELTAQFSSEYDSNFRQRAPIEEPRNNWEDCSDEKPVSRKESCDSSSALEDETNVVLKGWTDKKDKILKNLATKCKYDWKKIAKKFNESEKTTMTPLELKQRYKELSRVSIPLRVKFSHEEDLMIAKFFDLYGCDWAQVATHFTDRTAIMLKNRYYSHIRKRNLLDSMLAEVRGTTKETFISDNDCQENQYDNENVEDNEDCEDSEMLRILVENRRGVALRKLQVNNLYMACFEAEKAMFSELHERITFPQF